MLLDFNSTCRGVRNVDVSKAVPVAHVQHDHPFGRKGTDKKRGSKITSDHAGTLGSIEHRVGLLLQLCRQRGLAQ